MGMGVAKVTGRDGIALDGTDTIFKSSLKRDHDPTNQSQAKHHSPGSASKSASPEGAKQEDWQGSLPRAYAG